MGLQLTDERSRMSHPEEVQPHNPPPTVDRSLIAVVALVAAAAFLWLVSIAAITAEANSAFDRGIAIAILVVAATVTLIAFQVIFDFARRRRDHAHTDGIHKMAAACHADTIEALADMARKVEQISARLDDAGVPPVPLLAGVDSTEPGRAEATKVFEIGRRIGRREAERSLTATPNNHFPGS